MQKHKRNHITQARPNHKFVSRKNKQLVPAHNHNLLNLYYHLDFSDAIVNYAHPQNAIYYSHGGHYFPYTFDVRAEQSGKNSALNISVLKEVLPECIRKRITEACAAKGEDALFLASEEIQLAPRLRNLQILHKYAAQSAGHKHHLAVYNAFKNRRTLPLEELQKYFEQHQLSVTLIYTLIFDKQLGIDLHKPIKAGAIIRRGASTGALL